MESFFYFKQMYCIDNTYERRRRRKNMTFLISWSLFLRQSILLTFEEGTEDKDFDLMISREKKCIDEIDLFIEKRLTV